MNDYSYIEHLHLLFCAHLILINILLFFRSVELTWILYPLEMLRGCLVCVKCDSSSFHSFEHLCTFDIFGIVELGHYNVYTTFGVLTWFICV